MNCNGRLVPLEEPIIMGVINVTTDSFHRDSRVLNAKSIVDKAGQMISEGATIIDLGAMSSRPGASLLPVEIEKERLIMACESIRISFPSVLLSIDAYRIPVLEALIPYEIQLINDITGGQQDEEIWHFAAQHRLPYLLMHMKGNPETMVSLSTYDDIIGEMLDYYIQRIQKIIDAGVHDILLDPGIGFAKSIEQNFYVLRHLHVLQILQLPILIGLSRKSLIWKTLNIHPEDALNGTTALHLHALNQGASILRVHDVLEAKQTIQLWKKLQTQYQVINN